MRSLILVSGASVALLAVSCGSSQKNANDPNAAYGYQQPPPGYQQPGGYQQPPPGGYQQPPPGGYQQPPPGGYPPGYTAPPPGTTAPPPAGTTPPPPAGGGGAAQPIDPAVAGALTPVLTGVAGSEVQGMQPDGKSFAGNFQQGQTLEQPFTLQPGKCYSVVGVGAGIQQLDIMIAAQPMPQMPPQVLAQSNTQGPNATLGGKGACFKNPLPFGGPAKVIVKATAGSGMALAQIYVK